MKIIIFPLLMVLLCSTAQSFHCIAQDRQLSTEEQQRLGEEGRAKLLNMISGTQQREERISQELINLYKSGAITYQEFTRRNLNRIKLSSTLSSYDFDSLQKYYYSLMKHKNKGSDNFYDKWVVLRDESIIRQYKNLDQIEQLDRKNAALNAIQELERALEKTNNSIGQRRELVKKLRTSSNIQSFMEGLPNLDGAKKLKPFFEKAQRLDRNFVEKGEPTDEEKQQLQELQQKNANLDSILDGLESNLVTSECAHCLNKLHQ